MATVERFEELHIWQDARVLLKDIYALTRNSKFRRDFALRDQITRAASSTMSNIAEGFERASRKEFIQSLNVAKGSNGEVRSQLYAALDQEYIDQPSFEKTRQSALALSRRISAFMNYLETLSANSRTQNRRER